MKKIFLLLISLFTIIFTLSSCSKKEYAIISAELDDEKFNYVEIIDEDNTSTDVVCNYVKTVWGGNTDPVDIMDSIYKFSYLCDFNKEYKVKINLPTHELVKITGVTEYYFYNFESNNDNLKSNEIDYDIEDHTMTIDVNIKEFNNSHVFQFYRIFFKVDKTHYGYYYFGIRYGNELKSMKNIFTFLKSIDNNTFDYLEITSDDNTTKISNTDLQTVLVATVIDVINKLYVIKMDSSDYTDTNIMTFTFKVKGNDELYVVGIDENMICSYEGNKYYIISRDDTLKNYIKKNI